MTVRVIVHTLASLRPVIICAADASESVINPRGNERVDVSIDFLEVSSSESIETYGATVEFGIMKKLESRVGIHFAEKPFPFAS